VNTITFDLALTSSGWARWRDKRLSYGTIQGKGSGMARVHGILLDVQRLVEGADLVVLEGYSFASRGRAIVSLGEWGGTVRHWLHAGGLRWVEIPPACRCRYATGKGNASKEAVLAAAIRRLSYEGHSHDEADALWLLHMTLDATGTPLVKVPETHRTALAKIDLKYQPKLGVDP